MRCFVPVKKQQNNIESDFFFVNLQLYNCTCTALTYWYNITALSGTVRSYVDPKVPRIRLPNCQKLTYGARKRKVVRTYLAIRTIQFEAMIFSDILLSLSRDFILERNVKTMNKRSYIVSLLCFVGTSDLSLIAGEEKTTEYGVDVSWPIHYPWSVIDTEDDRYNERYPNQENEPASDILSDRKKIYNNFMEGCRKYFEKKPWVCDEDESDRILGNLEQPAIMMVRS